MRIQILILEFNGLRCLDTVFRDHTNIFQSPQKWLYAYPIAIKFSPTDFGLKYDNNKQKPLKLMKAEFLRDLDLLLKIRHKELWCSTNNQREKKNLFEFN